MYEQIELLEYLAECDNQKLISALAEGIIKHCKRWGYDFVDKLLKDPREERFIKIFCKITYTYYFHYLDDMYGACFSKKNKSVQIYKCGNNHEKILILCPIQKVIEQLITIN